MQTHSDFDHERNEEIRKAFKDLAEEAEFMMERRMSTITAGEEGEEPIREWRSKKVVVRELPERETDETLDLSRVSVGGIPGGLEYVVFRGPIKEVKLALRRALNALRDEPA